VGLSFKRQRQEDFKFKVSLDYIARSCLKKKKKASFKFPFRFTAPSLAKCSETIQSRDCSHLVKVSGPAASQHHRAALQGHPNVK
jgi:hypothetical protein